jgi:hypothetical protein
MLGGYRETRIGYLWEPEGNRPLGRQRRKWVNNIKMDLGEIELEVGGGRGLDWSGSGQEQVESSCDYGNEPSASIKRCEVLEWLHNRRPLELY